MESYVNEVMSRQQSGAEEQKFPMAKKISRPSFVFDKTVTKIKLNCPSNINEYFPHNSPSFLVKIVKEWLECRKWCTR